MSPTPSRLLLSARALFTRHPSVWRALSVVCALGPLALTASARAYVERTVTTRVTSPNGTGCIQFISGASHGNEHSAMFVTVQAALTGLTRRDSTTCNQDFPSDQQALLGGVMNVYLIKMITDRSTYDDYFLCHGFSSGAQWGWGGINYSHTYESAPCGAGYYAVVACLDDVNAYQVPSWTGGTYQSTAVSSAQCNVSPRWHPVGVGDSVTPGGVVNF